LTAKRTAEPTPANPGDPDLGVLNAAWHIGGPGYLALRLQLVAKLVDRYITRVLAEVCGLTVAEWRVVAQLAMADDSMVRELARQAWVDRAEVSRAVALLERKGLVERHPNPQDRRSPRFSLTPLGHEQFALFRPHWRALQEQLVSTLDAGEVATLNASLAGFASVLLELLHDED
jgi:DNA-binding MarR family transcriptional regulator